MDVMSEMSDNLIKKSRKGIVTRRWTPVEEVNVLNFIRDLKDSGFEIGVKISHEFRTRFN